MEVLPGDMSAIIVEEQIFNPGQSLKVSDMQLDSFREQGFSI